MAKLRRNELTVARDGPHGWLGGSWVDLMGRTRIGRPNRLTRRVRILKIKSDQLIYDIEDG